MKIPDAKAVVSKGIGESSREKSLPGQMDKVKSKKHDILEAQKNRALMDICHRKNAELEPKITEVQDEESLAPWWDIV